MRAYERVHGSRRRLDVFVCLRIEAMSNLALQSVGGIVFSAAARAMRFPSAAGSESSTSYMLMKPVLPLPSSGTSRAWSVLAFGGTSGIGHVGVPRQWAVIEEPDRLSVLQHVRNDEDLRMGVLVRRARHGRAVVEVAKAAAEPNQVRIAQPLVPHEDDAVFEPGTVHRGTGLPG